MKKRLLLVGILLFVSVVGARPALADEHQIGFDFLQVGYTFDGSHQAYEHLGITIASSYGVPRVVMANWIPSPTQALRNDGELVMGLGFTLQGFQADSVSLWVSKDVADGPVTAVLQAWGPTGLVDTDTVILPVGTINYFAQLAVEAGPGKAIDFFSVSYGGAAAEVVDNIAIQVREGPPIPPPLDTLAPRVRINYPDEDYISIASDWVSGYVDEDVALGHDHVDVEVQVDYTQIYLGELPILGFPTWTEEGLRRYLFGGRVTLQEGTEANNIRVTACDTSAHCHTASRPVYYDPPEYPAPPPTWPSTLDIRAGSEELCGVQQCGMEVTQAIQSWRQIGPTEHHPGTNPTYLIAGKRTLVRVYAEAMGIAVDVPNVNCRLEGYAGATPLPGSPLYAARRVTLTPGEDYMDQRSDPNKSFNFILPPEWTEVGGITLIATVNPHQNPPEGPGNFDVYNTVSLDVTFHDTDQFCVFVHPLRAHADGDVTPTESECVENLALTRQIYPVAPERFTVIPGSTHHTYIPLDGGGWQDDLNLALTAASLLTTLPSHFGLASDCDEVAFLSLTDDTVRHRGMTLPPLSVSVADDSFVERMRTAHELGHSQWMFHVQECGEPWPFQGDYPNYHDPVDNSFLPAASIGDWGANIRDDNSLRVLDPAATRDMMSYCDDLWISEYTWQWLADHFGVGGAAAANLAPRVEPLAPPPAPYLIINGTIGPTGTTTLQPAGTQILPEGSSDHPGTGAYTIKLLDVSYNVLFTRHLDPTPMFELEQYGVFQEIVPKKIGTRYIQLSGGAIPTPLTIAAGLSSPLVAITSPSGGETWDATGSREVTWLAGDANGDQVTCSLLYSADNGDTWQVIGSHLTDQWGLAVPLDNLPGCQNTCRLRLLATDGINQSEVTSQPFSKKGLPPWVNIISPKSVAAFSYGDLIILEGMVSDLEDLSLPAASIRWISSQDGELGTGLILGVSGLSAGLHEIWLKAIDSEDMVGSAMINVYVRPYHYVWLPLIVRND